MNNNINVINNSEKDLDVIVNNMDGNIQIIINTKEEIDLLSLKSGEVFEVNGIGYIALEQLDGNKTAVIRKELLDDNMQFDSDNNNWKSSDIRKKLNNDYLRELEETFGKDRIIEHTVDLLSLDGLDDYGVSTDKVSLFTIDQYRKYRKVLGENLNRSWWLATPDSTSSGYSTRYVLCVLSFGDVNYNDCNWNDKGVRPFFIIQS